MIRAHRRVIFALFVAAAVAPYASAGRQDDTRKQDDIQPITWGVMGQTPGCVIFAEGHKSSSRFSMSTPINKLTVLESENYTLDHKEYPETQQNLDTLMQHAQKDHIKYVKIPEKYSADLLEKARVACKQDQ